MYISVVVQASLNGTIEIDLSSLASPITLQVCQSYQVLLPAGWVVGVNGEDGEQVTAAMFSFTVPSGMICYMHGEKKHSLNVFCLFFALCSRLSVQCSTSIVLHPRH